MPLTHQGKNYFEVDIDVHIFGYACLKAYHMLEEQTRSVPIETVGERWEEGKEGERECVRARAKESVYPQTARRALDSSALSC